MSSGETPRRAPRGNEHHGRQYGGSLGLGQPTNESIFGQTEPIGIPNNGIKPVDIPPPIKTTEQAVSYREPLKDETVPPPTQPVTVFTKPEVKSASDQYQPKSFMEPDAEPPYHWKPAAGYSYLPTQPIKMSRDQEASLLDNLAAELRDSTIDQVKKVYEEMASKDMQLSGWGSYDDLSYALQKYGVSEP